MRPIHEMLKAASGRQSAHMPGHKGKAPFGAEDLYALDTTELPTTDDLYAPERGIEQAQQLYARAAGAAKTILLHNGTTAGIHVMVQLWAGEGDTVILPRNAHLSAVNGCVLGGVRVRWIPVTQTWDGYCYIREESVLQALEQHPEAKTLLLTRPDFYGGCIALDRIVEKAHRMGVRVVIDEAHGAHLPWSEDVQSAGALGADAWVQSVHKTLPGLTGAAALHLRDEKDHAKAMRILRREQTSSPSFLLLMSSDDARAYMEEKGAEKLKRISLESFGVRLLLPLRGYKDAHEIWKNTGLTFDPTRLVIDAPQGGAKLAQQLQEKGVDVEMHDLRRVVLILTAMDDPEEVCRLNDILEEIQPEKSKIPLIAYDPALPERAMEVREASMAECEWVALEKCAGMMPRLRLGCTRRAFLWCAPEN